MCVMVGVQSQQAVAAEQISFPNTTVGQTQTVQFTYTLLESSKTTAMISVTPPSAPFGLEGPLEFLLNPGQSRTLNVTFSPTGAMPYEGLFSISALGGIPPQVKTTQVTLVGTGVKGVTGISLPGLWDPPVESDPEISWLETELLEVKLDEVGAVLDEFRTKLDNLGFWLGQLIAGYGIGIEPFSTNPPVETSLWEMLAALEAKLDRLAAQPTEITIIEIYDVILQINVLIVNINQWVINVGGNVDKLEAKLDELSTDLFDLWLELIDMWNAMDAIRDELVDRFDDVEDVVAANARAIQTLQDSNNRIEDKLNELLRASGIPAPPSAADAAKIALAMGGGPLPSVPWEATVEGSAAAVQPGALVTIYWPIGLPPSTVIADGSGAFLLTVTTGIISYTAVDVTQTVGGYESARVTIPAS